MQAKTIGPDALPADWAFLAREGAPRLLVEALKTFGLAEIKGEAHAPEILAMASEVGGWIANWYQDDETPWCGLWMAAIAKRAGKPVTLKNPLSALAWAEWGDDAPRGADGSWQPELGDVCVFTRPGGGHVGLYVGETADGRWLYILGGNQGNRVSIARIRRSRLVSARRYFAIGKPANVRRIVTDVAGAASENEA